MVRQLIVIAGPDRGKVFELAPGGALRIGRSPATEARLADPRVSRVHCEVRAEGDGAVVTDSKSTLGTLVNGQRVARHALRSGDVIQVGDTQLRYHYGPASEQDTLPPPPPAGKRAARAAALAALSGQKLAHFEVGPVVATGQSGAVFRARDARDGAEVALKVLKPEFSQNEGEVRRFVRAMKTTLPLRHPNLVALYGAGKAGPYCWMAMEYVEGESLTHVIGRVGVVGMLDWRHALRVAVHVARALDYAHGRQIIHRNVTPANVIIRGADKVAKLGDLMLAKALEGVPAAPVTRPGELVGDVHYLAPERTQGDPAGVDGRSDVYGLGATVYALLTGRPPFADVSVVETVMKIRKGDPEKPSKFQMAVPDPFERAVLKMLARRPEERYQTAAELLAVLERFAEARGVPL